MRGRDWATRPMGTTTNVAGPHKQSHDGRENGEHNPEQLREYLDCWRLPGGRLEPAQARALLEWSGTPDDEKDVLRKSLELTQQRVPTRSLAPTQRRGHVGWLDRLRGVFRP